MPPFPIDQALSLRVTPKGSPWRAARASCTAWLTPSDRVPLVKWDTALPVARNIHASALNYALYNHVDDVTTIWLILFHHVVATVRSLVGLAARRPKSFHDFSAMIRSRWNRSSASLCCCYQRSSTSQYRRKQDPDKHAQLTLSLSMVFSSSCIHLPSAGTESAITPPCLSSCSLSKSLAAISF